jgi:hypothetical protein
VLQELPRVLDDRSRHLQERCELLPRPRFEHPHAGGVVLLAQLAVDLQIDEPAVEHAEDRPVQQQAGAAQLRSRHHGAEWLQGLDDVISASRLAHELPG